VRRIPVRLIVIIVIVLGAVIAATVYRVFFVWFVRVPTGAMMNSILIGDHLVAGRLFGEIDRGSVVVFGTRATQPVTSVGLSDCLARQ
jgi:signal peptidase I